MTEETHEARLVRLETRMNVVLDHLEKLVTRAEFAPVKLIAYGMASGVLMTVLGAVLGKVIIQ